jgi:hypothetical protein
LNPSQETSRVEEKEKFNLAARLKIAPKVRHSPLADFQAKWLQLCVTVTLSVLDARRLTEIYS